MLFFFDKNTFISSRLPGFGFRVWNFIVIKTVLEPLSIFILNDVLVNQELSILMCTFWHVLLASYATLKVTFGIILLPQNPPSRRLAETVCHAEEESAAAEVS